MRSVCKYGGDFVILPLRRMVRPGRGDDVVVDHEEKSRYGCLDIDAYKDDFELACKLAKMEEGLDPEGPIMIAIQDPESGSPVVLSKCVKRDGKKYFLAVVFNACFSLPNEHRAESYCLRMTEGVDPERIFTQRIMYSPGDNIAWDAYDLRDLKLDS